MGIVKIQAQTMFAEIPQRTAERRRVAPTPMMAPAMEWVVETGTLSAVNARMRTPPAVSAAKPSTGRSFVILDPIVFTMRQPPEMVPREMAVYALRMIQVG